ncbi:apolipoprotein N-acyltransferase [Bradyrhizobium sp. USDA 377]
MPSVKTNLFIALAIGAFVSAVLLAIEPLTDFAYLSLEWPGITAAYFFWGAVGGSTFVGIAISWLVNALTYGLGAFVVLSVLKVLREA